MGIQVRIQDGSLITQVRLDDQLIEFGTAVEDQDLLRALSYLEKIESNQQDSVKGLWNSLAVLSVEANEMRIASRCYAALGDLAKVRFLAEIIRMAEDLTKTISKLLCIYLNF